MRILHVIPNLKKGGAQRLALNIVSTLHSIPNIQVHLITFNSENDYSFLTNSVIWKIIPSRVIPSISRKSIVEIEQLQEYIDNFQPDIIHSHLFETEIVLAHAALSKGTKRIVHFHDNMHQMDNYTFKKLFKKSQVTNFFEKLLVIKSYPKNTTAICVSKNTEQFAIEVLPSFISKKLIYNAIDLNRFQPSKNLVKSNQITIIGSLIDNKGQKLAIDCIGELKSRGIIVHLNILGDGPNKLRLQKQIDNLSLQESVTIYGNVNYPEEYLKKSTIYLHTATYEAFGLVMIEAMACGIPVICTDGLGNSELIKQGENGFMVWERDPKLLADKIEYLFNNDILLEEMSEKAWKFAQNYGMESYIREILNIYSS
ncbi:MAG: glycosyltransferase [Crocinitomicaceae bacterium]